MRKKVYFILSAGFGPVVRALPVANMLKLNGIDTYFHVSGKVVASTMEKSGHTRISPRSYPQGGCPSPNWWNLDDFLSCFGWQDKEFVKNRFLAYREILESLKPDVIVVDFNTSGAMAARSLGVPVVAITQACFHPKRKTKHILWWKSESENIKSVTPVINDVLAEYGVEQISCAEELQTGNETIIPSIPEFDPLCVVDNATTYVGPLLGNELILLEQNVNEVDFVKDDKKKYVLVYPGRPMDAGGESGSMILNVVLPTLDELGLCGIIATGGLDYSDFEQRFKNHQFCSWVSMQETGRKCNVIIHHGGHGTCLSALTLGIPSLVIPTFSEREFNGRNMEKMGVSINLGEDARRLSHVKEALNRLLIDDRLKERALYWKNEIERRQYRGFALVFEKIMSLL